MGGSGSASMVSLSGERKCACVEELCCLGQAANVFCTASSASDSRGKMILWHTLFCLGGREMLDVGVRKEHFKEESII